MHNLVVAVVSSRSLRIPDLLCEDLAKSRVTLRVAAGIRLVIGEHYSPVTAVKLDVTHAASLIAADDFEAIASCLRRAVQDADLQRKSAQVFIAKVARAFNFSRIHGNCRSITGWFADQEIIARNLIRMLHRPNPRGQLGRGEGLAQQAAVSGNSSTHRALGKPFTLAAAMLDVVLFLVLSPRIAAQRA
jgi:hypothetical protein